MEKYKNYLPYIIGVAILFIGGVCFAYFSGYIGNFKDKVAKSVSENIDFVSPGITEKTALEPEADTFEVESPTLKPTDNSDSADGKADAAVKPKSPEIQADKIDGGSAEKDRRPSANQSGERQMGNNMRMGNIGVINRLLERNRIKKDQATKIIAVLEKYKDNDFTRENSQKMSAELDKLITDEQRTAMQKELESMRENRNNNRSDDSRQERQRPNTQERERNGPSSSPSVSERPERREVPAQEDMNKRYREEIEKTISKLKSL